MSDLIGQAKLATNLQPTCNQLATDNISRAAAIEVIENELDKIDHVPQWVFDRLTNRLRELPSAERKKGRWELAEDGWYCSSCELYPPFDCDPEEKGIPFCPNCGADMRGEEYGND